MNLLRLKYSIPLFVHWPFFHKSSWIRWMKLQKKFQTFMQRDNFMPSQYFAEEKKGFRSSELLSLAIWLGVVNKDNFELIFFLYTLWMCLEAKLVHYPFGQRQISVSSLNNSIFIGGLKFFFSVFWDLDIVCKSCYQRLRFFETSREIMNKDCIGRQNSGSLYQERFSWQGFLLMAKDYTYFIILSVYWPSIVNKKFKWICAGMGIPEIQLHAHPILLSLWSQQGSLFNCDPSQSKMESVQLCFFWEISLSLII